eukprot:scaffold2562_cov354-Prasinococcus_capsulatus_cf.AAC.5
MVLGFCAQPPRPARHPPTPPARLAGGAALRVRGSQRGPRLPVHDDSSPWQGYGRLDTPSGWHQGCQFISVLSATQRWGCSRMRGCISCQGERTRSSTYCLPGRVGTPEHTASVRGLARTKPRLAGEK